MRHSAIIDATGGNEWWPSVWLLQLLERGDVELHLRMPGVEIEDNTLTLLTTGS